jgi:hypothetical protein
MTDPTALPNLPGFGGNPAPTNEPPSEAPLGDRLSEALRALELNPQLDADGDLTFQVEQQQLFIRFSEDDAQVLRVFGRWRLAEPVPTDVGERLAACNDVNIAFNMVKTAIADETLLVTSEHMLPRGADVRSLLMVAIPLVLQGVSLWHQRAIGEEKLAELQAQEQAAAESGSAFGLNGDGPQN